VRDYIDPHYAKDSYYKQSGGKENCFFSIIHGKIHRNKELLSDENSIAKGMKKMKKYLKMPRALRRATLLAMLPVFFLAGCGQKTECEKSIDTAMGTVISQTVYVTGNSATTTNSEINEKITDVLLQELNDLEQKELSWRLESAEVARINATAGEGQTSVSPAMAEWLGRCRQISEESAGAFDVSIGRLSRLWDIDTWAAADDPQDYELPEREEIEQACALAGWQQMILEQRTNSTVVSIPAGMQIDLGAVGKGVALDEIRKILEEYPEVSGAVISVGGSILTYGNKPEGGTWQIAVTDPLEPSQSVGVLTLDGGYCVSTSGDYERYVEVDGVRYHHILDPRTGSPARSDVAGVTIVTKDGFLSDALSTACFVLGSEEGQKLLEKYDAEGLFIDHAGTITMTEGMQQYFHLSNSQK